MRSALVKAASIPALVVLIGAIGLVAPGSADTLTPFDLTGTVTSTGQPAPNVSGATGSFTVGSITEFSGNFGATPGGSVTVYTDPDTTFWLCDSTGQNCAKSSQTAVVVPGDVVYVTGRYAGSGSSADAFASNVFNPPPAPSSAPPPPPNPQPSSLGDYTFHDVFGVNAYVGQTSTPIDGNLVDSSLWGFVLHDFVDYGCGTQTSCTVQQIVLAHSGQLEMDADNDTTTMWLSNDGGCTYAKTTDRYTVVSVVGTTQGLVATGHYGWDGTDWRFFATNIFAPAPAPPSSCPSTTTLGPLSAGASLVEQSPGTYDSSTSTYRGTQWTGQMGPTGPFSDGTATMTLDWTYNQAAADWDFSGSWTVAAQAPSTTGLSGTISGTSTMPPPPPGSPVGSVNAQVTVDQGTGTFAGYTGYGTWSGSDTFGSAGGSQPPVQQTGQYHWEIGP